MRRFLLGLAGTLCAAALHGQESPVVLSEPVFEQHPAVPFRQCHASTLAEWAPGELVAAWFGGPHEKHPDVGIWLARKTGSGPWSAPVEVADGVERPAVRYPTWNPVLFGERGREPELLLFYKVGPSPSEWWGMLKRSRDGGETWSPAERLPDGILGPIKNKPVRLPGGSLLAGSSTEHDGWKVHFELADPGLSAWRRTADVLEAGDEPLQAIQPTILVHPDGRLQALCRSRADRIVETFSEDGGRTWSPLEPTALPNPSAGLDAVTLRDGRHLLVYNHTTRGPGSRARLNVAVSEDGRSWSAVVELENSPSEFSYPAVLETRDGLVHITYTWRRRRIQHVVLDPQHFRPVPITGAEWPLPAGTRR